jgi:hypothetical protein
MSELEPRKRRGREVATRRIPQEIIPVPIAEAREFVRDAVSGTNLTARVPRFLSGWAFFEPLVRFTAVDAGHTRVELDIAGTRRGAEIFLYPQRRAEIHRFFVALQDELDRRERWRPELPAAQTHGETPDQTRDEISE